MDYRVTIKEVASEQTASIRGKYPIGRLPEMMGKCFGQVMEALTAEGMRPTGGALAIYHGWSEELVDVEMALTIRGVFFPQGARGGVKPSMVPGGKVAFTVHVGPYDQLEAAYGAIQEYAQTNGLKLADMMWERYLTDPALEPDLSRHVTEVYWPLV
jgi:effector-binding domain-containing protein